MVPGRRYRRSTPVAVRCTCGVESELEEGENRLRTTCPNSKHEEKTIIDTLIRSQTSTSPTTAEAPPTECSMHAPAHAVV